MPVTKRTQKADRTPDQAASDAAALNDGLDGKAPLPKSGEADKKEAAAGDTGKAAADNKSESKAKDDAKPEEGGDPAKGKSEPRFKTVEDAILAVDHLETVQGKQGTEIDEKARANEQLTQENQQLKTQLDSMGIQLERISRLVETGEGQPRGKGVATTDDDDEAGAAPLKALIREEAKSMVDEALAPMKNSEARRRAQDIRAQMIDEFGEQAWEKTAPYRRQLVDDFKAQKIPEPKIWMLAYVGQRYLAKATSVGPDPKAEDAAGGPTGTKDSARDGSETEKAQTETRPEADVLSEALDGGARRKAPLGVHPLA